MSKQRKGCFQRFQCCMECGVARETTYSSCPNCRLGAKAKIIIARKVHKRVLYLFWKLIGVETVDGVMIDYYREINYGGEH